MRSLHTHAGSDGSTLEQGVQLQLVFGFAPPDSVSHDTTNNNFLTITLLCRSKRLTISNLLAWWKFLVWQFHNFMEKP